MFSQQRRFLKVIAMSDRIQVGWSHPNNAKYPELEYVLEYGCGIKFMGQEQFRKIY